MSGYVKCFHCKEQVLKDEAKSYRYITESNPKGTNRNFHEKCYEIHRNNQQERAEMDKLWDYIKNEIWKSDKKRTMPNHLLRRLQALKGGLDNNYVSRGNQVFGNNEGYEYEVILYTFKVCKIQIVGSILDKSKFKNDNHLIDYMMAIVRNNIEDVYTRIQEKKKSDERIEKVDISENFKYKNEFVKKTDLSKNKIANKLKHLF
jgi:hypothetical protein